MATPEQIILGYNDAVHIVRSRVEAYAKFAWRSSGSWRDADVDRLVALIVPKVQAGQVKTAQLTAAYLAALQTARTGAVVAPVSVVADLVTSARGVPAEAVYRRPAATMYNALSKGATVSAAIDMGIKRLGSLVSTDHQLAKTTQARQSMSGSGFEFMRRTLTGRENCALCVIASTQRYRVQDLQPIHPGCVPTGSVVSVPSGEASHSANIAWGEILAVTRRQYLGELIEFVTASGDEVRVTPNHPVLTDRGWLPAGLLSEGDAVFRTGGSHRIVGGGPDVDDSPALVEDVFEAARMAFPLVRVPLASEDFHGDTADGEVDVVYTNGRFPSEWNSALDQPFSEGALMHAHGRRGLLDGSSSLGSLLESVDPTASGLMGSGGLRGDFFGGHFGCSEHSGAAARPRFDAPAGEFGFESAAVYASQGRNLIGRLAGDVEGDSIVELRRVSFSGHVFNLHTREGWYSSNNHIVSNCDCGSDVVEVGQDPGQIIAPELLDLTHTTIDAKLGYTDRSARNLGIGKTTSRGDPISDYTDLIVINQHGELGPVLAWRSEKFTSASDIAALAH